MRNEPVNKSFELLIALVIFSLALMVSIPNLKVNNTFNKWVKRNISEKQLVTESEDYDVSNHLLTVGEVIEEIKTQENLKIYVNGSLVSDIAVKNAKDNPELFNSSPFNFLNEGTFEKEYGYDADGKITELHYTLQ